MISIYWIGRVGERGGCLPWEERRGEERKGEERMLPSERTILLLTFLHNRNPLLEHIGHGFTGVDGPDTHARDDPLGRR